MLAFFIHETFLDRKKLVKLFFSAFLSFYFYKIPWKKCPECYGHELCRFFSNNQIRLTFFSGFLTVFQPGVTKSVFHGFFNDTRVVIKRKGRRSQPPNVVLCRSVRGKFLFKKKHGLWSDIEKSIEPHLLTDSQTKNWPFPKYLGACGDLIVEEYKGQPLAYFLNSDFPKRVNLSIQLLQMAELFTFGYPELSFYFTDYSNHNIVVDSKGRLSFIDLDNVIISNRSKENYSVDCEHESTIFYEFEYAFSTDDICMCHISDHNYYSISKYLLSHPHDGLLYNIPKEFTKRNELLELLNDCTQPKDGRNRFTAVTNLLLFLVQITKT